MTAVVTNGRPQREVEPGTRSRGRKPPGANPRRDKTRSRRGSRLRGLGWVPAPLAVLAAVVGWLLLGSLQGQNAARQPQYEFAYQAGGLGLTVDQMLWMSNDMTGQGPLNVTPKGFSMPASQMHGMQTAGNNRLRVDVDIQNITSRAQRYKTSDFRVVGPGGKTWRINNDGAVVGSGIGAVLQPGFQATVDLYFDIPTKQSKDLSIRWSHGGTTVEFPVVTNGAPSPHHH